ncbi:hypothetical protein Afe04nite_53550 [Asanoa ferruginea]|nr:hypothetical protein Afe04nite_53550 [Asanoa ferruginea]
MSFSSGSAQGDLRSRHDPLWSYADNRRVATPGKTVSPGLALNIDLCGRVRREADCHATGDPGDTRSVRLFGETAVYSTWRRRE